MSAARLTARRDGDCSNCGSPITFGDRILYDNKKVVGCLQCCFDELQVARQEISLTAPIRVRVTYISSQRDDWAALKVVPLEKLPQGSPAIEGAFSVVGEAGLAALKVGDTADVVGTWKHNPRFGWQLRVTLCVKAIDASAEATVEFLGQIPEIGGALAEKLVSALGPTALLQSLAGKAPGPLLSVLGDDARPVVDDERLQAIFRAYDDRRDLRGTWQWLQQLGLGEWLTKRILQVLKGAAKRKLEANPFCLVSIEDIGFEKADEIGRKMAIRPDDPRRLEAAVLHVVLTAANEGHLWSSVETIRGLGDRRDPAVRAACETGLLPDQLSEGLRLALANVDDNFIFEADGRIYLANLYDAEQKVAQHLWRIFRGAKPLDASSIMLDPAFHEKQRHAFEQLAEHGILLLTGGPGTGKTTVTKVLLDLLQVNGRRIACCAPTGKAALRLSAQTGRGASTIHRLLSFDPKEDAFTFNEATPLPFDAIIVDETSMVDVQLFHALLSAIKTGSALIIVGDSDQLPSVGPGAVLRDLISAGCLPHVKLTQIFRQAEASKIPHLARAINEGALPPAVAGADVVFIPIADAKDIQPVIVQLLSETITKSPLGAHFRVTAHDDIQVLAAQHEGDIGVKRLNALLQERLNFGDGGVAIGGEGLVRECDRVIQTRNDYDLGVLNGEIGTVLKADPEGLGASVAALLSDEELKRYMPSDAVRSSKAGPALLVDYGDRIVGYLKFGTRALQLAYCCTVHKAQGSQFPCVVVPIHSEHSYMLTRSLVYTAITRAERLLVLVGDVQALYAAVGNLRGQTRRTSLREALDRVALETWVDVMDTPHPADTLEEAAHDAHEMEVVGYGPDGRELLQDFGHPESSGLAAQAHVADLPPGAWVDPAGHVKVLNGALTAVLHAMRNDATKAVAQEAPPPVVAFNAPATWNTPYCEARTAPADEYAQACGRPGITVEDGLTKCATHWNGTGGT